jgi:hypothetical protein
MWVYLPETTLACSRAPLALISDLGLLAPRLAVSVMSRSELKPAKFWLQGLRKDRWPVLRFGAMLEPSRQTSIVAAWLESLEDGPVRPSVLPGSAAELKTSDGSGLKSSECFAKLTPNGLWEKMSPAYCLPTMEGHSGMFSETWPASGSMRNGCVYERPTWEPATAAIACGSWPTAQAEDAKSCGNHPQGPREDYPQQQTNLSDQFKWLTPHGMNGVDHTGKEGRGGEFAKQATNWTTPQAHDVSTGDPNRVRRYGTKHGAANLTDDVCLWPTPNAHDGRRPGVDDLSTQGGNLNREAGAWGTPTSRDWKDGTSADTVPENGLLGRQAGNWPTPNTEDASGSGSARTRAEGKQAMLHDTARTFLSSLPAPAQPSSGSESSEITRTSLPPSARKKLNPLFAAWLMGWPVWWASKEPMPSAQSEMELYLFNARRLLSRLLGDS